jgi:regulator of protease activity HflC (stomatin/prohibitin superfamily)
MTKGSTEKGRVTASLVLILLLVSGLGALWYSFGKVVPVGSLGLRQIFYGPGKGYASRALEPGYHWTIPFYSQIHLLPRSIAILPLTRETGTGLEVKTSDGAVVDVDVSVFSRVFPERTDTHGGPSDLVTRLSLNVEQWQKQIRIIVTGILREKLSNLQASSFYSPEERLRLTSEAEELVRKSLAVFGLQLDELLLRRYTYRSESINEAIFRKNLQDQEVRLNATKSRFAEVRAEVDAVSASWDAKIKTLLTSGQNEALVTRSDAERYEAEKRALGDLNVAKASAEADRLRSDALANSTGVQNYIARENAALVSSLKGGVVTNIDPYNIDQWVDRVGGRQ